MPTSAQLTAKENDNIVNKVATRDIARYSSYGEASVVLKEMMDEFLFEECLVYGRVVV